MATRKSLPARFWSHVKVVNDGLSCWEWQAGRLPAGYGRTNIGMIPELAHRVSYILMCGSIPEGLQVLHTCDNPTCVRPSHLYAGTQSRNLTDMMRRGRRKYKLNKQQAGEIILLYSTGRFTQADIAAKYGVERSIIGRVVNGERWMLKWG